MVSGHNANTVIFPMVTLFNFRDVFEGKTKAAVFSVYLILFLVQPLFSLLQRV